MGDYHLLATSPITDIGTGVTAPALAVDFDGDARPSGSGVDIGADEALASAATFTLLYPNNGEPQAGLTVANIRWTALSGAATYWVRFSSDGGTTWSRLATQDAALPTNYSWSIPNNINSANCLINVIAFNGAGQWLATDTSDGVFTVAPVP